MSTKPAALHYAEVLEGFYLGLGRLDATGAAAELRRLHALNAELLEALRLARLVVNPHHEFATQIAAAIAKAEGQP